jgi:hypothetical protein
VASNVDQMTPRCAWIALVTATSLATSALGQTAGTYSSLRKDDEGTLVGYELRLVRKSGGAYTAHFRCAYGKLGKSVALNVTVDGKRLSTQANDSDESLCPDGPFVGQFKGNQLIGRFEDPSQIPSNWLTELLRLRTRP